MYRLGSLVDLLEQRLNTLEERYFVLLNRVEELQRIANASKQSQPSSAPFASSASSSPTPSAAFASSAPPVSVSKQSRPSSPSDHVAFSMTPIPATDAHNDMLSLLASNNEDNDAKVVQATSELIGPVEEGEDIF